MSSWFGGGGEKALLKKIGATRDEVLVATTLNWENRKLDAKDCVALAKLLKLEACKCRTLK